MALVPANARRLPQSTDQRNLAVTAAASRGLHQVREVADRLNVDLDEAGEVVGFDIDHASKRSDLTTLETVSLPLAITGTA